MIGRNLKCVQEASGLDPWTTSVGKMKEALMNSEEVEIPNLDERRLPYLCRRAHVLPLEGKEKYRTGLIESFAAN